MKKIFYIALFILSISACSEKKRIDPNPVENLVFGKVDTVSLLYVKAIQKFGKVEEGWFQYAKTFIYNNRGLVSEENLFLQYTQLRAKFIYKYDDDDKLISCDVYNGQGELESKITYTYDLVSNIVYQIQKSVINNFIMSNYTGYLNENGKLTEVIFYDNNGAELSRKKYRYDELGNQIESSIEFNNSVNISSSQYSDIDKRGNWLKQIIYENNEPEIMVIRSINYKD
ncbi:MAG: hypothetical protein O9294_07585 [Cytophagales bacterium]|nr:hypothetical protein [Cytophagales bacterium]